LYGAFLAADGFARRAAAAIVSIEKRRLATIAHELYNVRRLWSDHHNR
jgi:hypothetical protein